MGDSPTNCLVPIDRSNWRESLRVRVTDEQLPMAADSQPIALVILAKAYVRDGDRRWEPLAYVDADGAMIAVLALTHAGGTAEVRNLAVDVDAQGAGVGTALMHAVIEWCRKQDVATVEVTFHPANVVAKRLYERTGFTPTGATRNGEPLWRVRLADA